MGGSGRAGLLSLGRNLRGQAEWVTSRIEQYSPSVWCGLDWCKPRPEPFGFGDGRLQIRHPEIKVDLLGDVPSGPRWGLVVGHLDRGEPHPLSANADGRGRRELHLSAEHRGPEVSQWSRLSAIQRDEYLSGDCHGPESTGTDSRGADSPVLLHL
jgi:hypothetical protein